jgi:cytochrome c peroxidase
LADATGETETFSTSGTVDHTNPFFQSLGTNGRTCATCHVQALGWSITPDQVQATFDATNGLDPLFAIVDGTNSPLADMSTLDARTLATSMIRSRGVIRVGRPIPTGAEFVLDAVDDPYNFASASQLSLFRRPLPSTNVAFASTLMWDDRNTVQPILPSNSPAQNLAALQANLNQTSIMATINHAQGSTPTQDQLDQITAFQLALFTAQIEDVNASQLDAAGAAGGAVNLAGTPFFVGTNDPFGQNPTGAAFNSTSMTMFSPWSLLTPTPPNDLVTKARDSVARGENIFNTRTFQITGVTGLNDVLKQTSITGTCSTCHDTPDVGNHSIDLALNTGIAALQGAGEPLYTLRNVSTGQTVQTVDPGLAMTTGKWADVGKFKVPVLRGLAARLPLFHDGSAHDLVAVGRFYNGRLKIGLSSQDINDLASFLATL